MTRADLPNSGIRKVKVTIGNEVFKGEDIYPLSPGTFRGNVIIVNFNEFPENPEYQTRVGSQKDMEDLKELFSQTGFEVFPFQDLRRTDFLVKILEFSEVKTHGDIVIVVVMSHGESGGHSGKIITSDGKKVDVEEDIIRHFNNANEILRDKPKIFLFQACLGTKRDSGVNLDSTPIPPGAASPPGAAPQAYPMVEMTESENKDMLICDATVHGYVSLRSSEGSWFIQELCKVFMENSHNKPIRKMLDMVNRSLQRKVSIDEHGQRVKQCSEYRVRGFNKDLFLHPGLNLE